MKNKDFYTCSIQIEYWKGKYIERKVCTNKAVVLWGLYGTRCIKHKDVKVGLIRLKK